MTLSITLVKREQTYAAAQVYAIFDNQYWPG